MDMTPDQIKALFTRSNGDYLFSRWGRPISPVVFGVEDQSLAILKGAIEAVVHLAGHQMSETDPELGSNFMLFFIRDWEELAAVPGLGRLIPDLLPLLERLVTAKANQYRVFRFDANGGIKACFAFVKMDGDMAEVPAEDLALNQAVQAILLWSDTAFRHSSALATLDGRTVLRPDIARIIQAAYDPVMPLAAQEDSHALRIMARIAATLKT